MRLSLPRDLVPLSRYLEPRVFWPGALSVALVSIATFLSDGLQQSESNSSQILRPPAAAVALSGEARTRNNFTMPASQVMQLRAAEPSVAVWLTATGGVQLADHHSKRQELLRFEQSVQLVSDNIFQYMGGRFTWGRPFGFVEAMAGKRYVVLSEGFLKAHLNTVSVRPTEVFINGLSFQVLGVWQSPSDQIEESSTIWVPVSAAGILGDADRTAVSRFVLPNSSIQALDRLKRAIDRFQLNMGSSFSRPEFSWVDIGATSKNATIWRQRLKPLELVVWVMVFAILAVSSFAWDKLLSQNWRTLAARQLWVEGRRRQIRAIAFPIFVQYWIWCAAAVGVAALTTWLFEGISQVDFTITFHQLASLPMLALLVGVPALAVFSISRRLDESVPWYKLLK